MLVTILFPFKKVTNNYRLVSKKANANIYNVLWVNFKKFYQIFSLDVFIYCVSEGKDEVSDGPPDSCDSGLDTILYSASSHAPRSMSLHRREQNGKNFAFSDWVLNDASTVL